MWLSALLSLLLFGQKFGQKFGHVCSCSHSVVLFVLPDGRLHTVRELLCDNSPLSFRALSGHTEDAA